MLYLGARNQTEDQMKEVLGYNFRHLSNDEVNQQFATVLRQISDVDSNKYQLNVANRLVAQQNFHILESFKKVLRNFSKQQKQQETQIHNKIPKLLSQPLDSSTLLVLLNAVYFKGIFATKLLKNETKEEIFFNRGVNQIKKEMMKRNGKFNYTEIQSLYSKLLEITYSGDDLSPYILLPNERQGFNKLNNNLKDFAVIENSIRYLRESEVDVTISKFKIEAEYELKQQLSQLGMRQVFTSEADLSGINGKKSLEFSKVIHKAVVEVNEEGSEAFKSISIFFRIQYVYHNIL
jgi:serpin B